MELSQLVEDLIHRTSNLSASGSTARYSACNPSSRSTPYASAKGSEVPGGEHGSAS